MRYRRLHPVTADHRREIDIRSLARHGAFVRPMRFPFQGIETARDHIRIFSPGNRQRPPQIIAVTWRQMTFGLKPFFVCPRCNARRVYLYFDGLFAYCRLCADLRFLSQRKRPRTRLLFRSHRIRVALGDQFGKPGDQFPAHPFNQKQRAYRKAITTLRHIEQRYLHIAEATTRNLYRDRDERGCFIAAERDQQTIAGAWVVSSPLERVCRVQMPDGSPLLVKLSQLSKKYPVAILPGMSQRLQGGRFVEVSEVMVTLWSRG
jgi:hypothetical protein